MYGTRIFEIPVYRKHPGKLVDDLDKVYLSGMLRIDANADVTSFRDRRSYGYFRERHGNPYPYNQVVGWIVLWVGSDSILGEYYALAGKRLTHSCKKLPFEWLGNAFEVYISDDDTDESISKRLREEIQRQTKAGRFRRRWIDLEAFDNLTPFIKWRKIVDASVL